MDTGGTEARDAQRRGVEHAQVRRLYWITTAGEPAQRQADNRRVERRQQDRRRHRPGGQQVMASGPGNGQILTQPSGRHHGQRPENNEGGEGREVGPSRTQTRRRESGHTQPAEDYDQPPSHQPPGRAPQHPAVAEQAQHGQARFRDVGAGQMRAGQAWAGQMRAQWRRTDHPGSDGLGARGWGGRFASCRPAIGPGSRARSLRGHPAGSPPATPKGAHQNGTRTSRQSYA